MDGVVDVYRGYFSRVKESHEFFLGEIFTVLLVQREKETLLLKRVSILSSLRLSGSIIRFLLFRQKTERERRSVLFLLVLREDGGGGGNFVLGVVFVCVLASRLLSNVVGVFCRFRQATDSLLLLSRRRDFFFCRPRALFSSVLEYFRVHLAHSLFEGFAEGASLGFIVVSAHQVAVLAV